MVRHKLRDTQVRAAKEPGRIGDGDGLYLHVSKSGGKSWVFIYTRDGRRREMGLGSYGSGTGHVSLVDARAKANEVRSILGRGGDPFTEMGERKALASKVTFETVVAQFLGTMESSWRNEKHRSQWRMTLGPSYCGPILKKPIDAIDTIAVLKVLSPIWETKNETATRVRGRIEKVIDHATAKGLRTGDNPARWKGHLDHLLPSVTKMVRGHHAAMPYSEVPAFMARLRGMMGDSARALELTVLTAGRTGEVLGAKWPEFDLDAAVWTVPADRMKAGREHRVPLGPAAVAVIERQASLRRSEYVFPGQSGRKPLSNMAMVSLLRRMDLSHFTVHGFRSAFRDWAAEETEVPREIAEAALAHVVGDATERAYRRGDALERRRVLMIEWERHCGDADG